MYKIAALVLGLGLSGGSDSNLPVVGHVDLERYQGTWYEIGALPQPFEAGCVAVQAEYTLQDDGTVKVVNSCRNGTFDGSWRRAEGTARVVEATTNAKLKVVFGAFGAGDYWIIDLASDYSYAMVGAPDRSSLWVLSRERTLDDATYDMLLDKASDLGFAVVNVRLMPQPAE